MGISACACVFGSCRPLVYGVGDLLGSCLAIRMQYSLLVKAGSAAALWCRTLDKDVFWGSYRG